MSGRHLLIDVNDFFSFFFFFWGGGVLKLFFVSTLRPNEFVMITLH